MEIKLLSCPLCLQPHFDNVDTLRTQLVNVATSHLTCPVCSETLLGLDKLTIHLFSHVIQIEQPLQGIQEQQQQVHNEIDKSINQIANNQQQQTVQHKEKPIENGNDKNVRCDICNFTFSDQNILDMHQKLLHQTTPDKKTGMYSYHCHLCSKKFKMRGSLMVHLRVAHYGFAAQHYRHHQDEIQTEIAKDENSKDKSTVEDTNSNKNKIVDNKQWECDVCAKMFTTKYFLKKHKRLHTGNFHFDQILLILQ